jgi:hypothetical protein
MLQAAPQFTPFQLLHAGRRAEAEGRMDVAFQLYRRTADQYAYSSEAAEAREGLARLQIAWAPNVWQLNGTPPEQPAEAARRGAAAARKARRVKSAAPPNAYRTGEALAKLVSVLGWLIVFAGFAAAPAFVLLGRPELGLGAWGLFGAAVGAALLGLIAVALGQATRAVFDQANQTRELVAIARAKAGAHGP